MLYAVEMDPGSDGRVIMHIWPVQQTATSVERVSGSPSSVQLFPNPASHQLNVVPGSAESVGSVLIINTLGQIVRQIDNCSGAIDISPLPGGVYHAVFSTSAGMVTRRFLIAR